MQNLRDTLREREKQKRPPTRHVIVTGTAFANFISYANQGASFRQPRDQWVMALGFLFCRLREDAFVIEDVVGAAYGSDMSVEVLNHIFPHIERLKADRPGTVIGGMACSRPGLGLFASNTDMMSQMYHQHENPDALGLYFDLACVTPTSLGLFLWRLHTPNSSTYYQITDYTLEGFTRGLLQESLGGAGIDPGVIAQLVDFFKLTDKPQNIEISRPEKPVPFPPHK